MESIIIVTPCNYDETFRSRIPVTYKIGEGASGVTIVEDGRSRIYIGRNASVRGELKPSQLESIASTLPDPSFYTIDFSDIAFCRKVLAAIANDPRVLLDNDHGVLLSGSDFVRVLRSQPDWDWRRDRG
jgi:hypothetical protein